MTDVDDVSVRPYDDERAGLWELKRGFELGLGGETGGEEKQTAYEAKLTEEYREDWLAWVDRCVEEDPDCVQVAVAEGPSDAERGVGDDAVDVVGYAFVLPASLAFIWDAAVLNEIYVAPDARGTGIADDLMEGVLDCARTQALPLERLVLDVDRENERARAFYDRYGFEHWGEMVARPL